MTDAHFKMNNWVDVKEARFWKHALITQPLLSKFKITSVLLTGGVERGGVAEG